MLRFLTAGESHGKGLVVIVEGLPAGLPITVEEIQAEMARRRLGFGRGPRQRFEVDNLTLLGGVRHGRTLGSPVAIEIENESPQLHAGRDRDRRWIKAGSDNDGHHEAGDALLRDRIGGKDAADQRSADA